MIENETGTTYDNIQESLVTGRSQVKRILRDHLIGALQLDGFAKRARVKWSGQMLKQKLCRVVKILFATL